jgi:transcription antitermination factor NusG
MQGYQWHALQVRRRFERIVALHLSAQRIEHYLPTLPISRQPAKRTDCMGSPLFPGYVLCRCDLASSLWTIPGVLSLVQGTNDIQAVSEREINALRRILASGLEVQRRPFVSQGRIAMIEEGPLSGVTGILEEGADKRMFVVSIQLIRQSIGVTMPFREFHCDLQAAGQPNRPG